MKQFVFYLVLIIATLLLLEGMVRVSGRYRTQSEMNGGGYLSYYDQKLPTWYHTWPPNQPIVYDEPEIKCSYPANSLGLREREIPLVKNDSTRRLFVIGDSFVEGDGVAYPYSMPRFLEKKMDSAGMNFEVFNAGVCASDPFYEYVLLRDKLIRYHPTHVIVCINNSDITDYIFRGGMERFQSDGTTIYRKGPWYKMLYAHSRLFRFIISLFGYGETLLSPGEMNRQTKIAIEQIYQCLESFKSLCEQNHIKYMVVIHPFPASFSGKDVVDHRLRCQCPAKGPVNMIDLYYPFDKYMNQYNYLQYGWKLNQHFNAKGYQLYADILFDKINECDAEFWK